jgi:hypothetical protein
MTRVVSDKNRALDFDLSGRRGRVKVKAIFDFAYNVFSPEQKREDAFASQEGKPISVRVE